MLTVLVLVACFVAGNSILWIGSGPILATLSAIAFGLAFFALQWNKTRDLLIPAAVMAPILSLVSLIFFIIILVDVSSLWYPARAIITALIYLVEAILSAYYWVGLMTLYDLKKPTGIPNVDVA